MHGSPIFESPQYHVELEPVIGVLASVRLETCFMRISKSGEP